MPMHPALFLDRDGVLNVDRGFVSRIKDLEWIEGAFDCVRAFKARRWFVFVVTNQTGIARGLYTEDDMNRVHAHILETFASQDAQIDRIYHCADHPEGKVARYARENIDRKPGPGMLLRAMADFPVRREASFLIGDKQTDIDAAHAAGVGGFLFTGGNLANYAEWALAAFEDGAR